MAQKENHATHWVLGGALLLIGLFVIIALVMIRSQAQDVTLSIDDEAPSIAGGTAVLCPGATANTNAGVTGCTPITSIDLNAGSTLAVSYFVQVTDNNGISTISASDGRLRKSTVTNSCTADNNDCYIDAACAQISETISSTTAWFRCDYTLEYYMDETITAGNFVGYFNVTDGTTPVNDSTFTVEVAKEVAGTFPTVPFGALTPPFTSGIGDNEEIQHNNNGNVILEWTVRLDDTDTNSEIDCATNGVPVAQVKFDVDASGVPGDLAFANLKETLTIAAQDIELDLSPRTNDGAAQGPTNPRTAFGATGDDQAYSYWGITLEAGIDALGACSEELIVVQKEND